MGPSPWTGVDTSTKVSRSVRLPKQAVHPRRRTQLHNGLAQSLQRQFGLPQPHGKNWLGSRAVQPSESECASVAASLARASTAVIAIGLKVVKNASITVDRIAATLRSLNLVIVESIHVVDPVRIVRGPLIERLASDFRYSRAREIVKSRSSCPNTSSDRTRTPGRPNHFLTSKRPRNSRERS